MTTIPDLRRAIRQAPRPGDRTPRWLARHGIDVLRVCLGLVITGFGALKFFPGVSRSPSAPSG